MKNVSHCALFFFIMLTGCSKDDDGSNSKSLPENVPDVSEATFSQSTNITNPYYGPPADKVYIYMGGEVGASPEEEIRIQRRTSTKVVMGVTCIIQQDVVTADGILVEDTDDWIAQDDEGNLWYFGELVKNYDDEGNFANNNGSFEAGVDGALPGYWFPANPTVGMVYYQEYAVGVAEDQGEIIAVGETVTIGLGTYTDCVVTKDINPAEPNIVENKFYAPGIGFIKEEKFEDNELVETVELVAIEDQ